MPLYQFEVRRGFNDHQPRPWWVEAKGCGETLLRHYQTEAERDEAYGRLIEIAAVEVKGPVL